MVAPSSSSRRGTSSGGGKWFMIVMGTLGALCLFWMTNQQPQQSQIYLLLSQEEEENNEELPSHDLPTKIRRETELSSTKKEQVTNTAKTTTSSKRTTTNDATTTTIKKKNLDRPTPQSIQEFNKKKAQKTTTTTTQTTTTTTTKPSYTSKTNGKDNPLNILILYGDDWTLKTLGLLNSFVKTPNLDAMAKNGILFTHNCVTTSICMVSRATMYTGQYASRHNHLQIGSSPMFREGVWNETLFPLLKEYGKYHVGMVGKWHHMTPNDKIKPVFDMFRSYQGSHYIKRGSEEKQITEWNELDALEFLQTRPRDKHFALLVSFFAIHAEDSGPEQYRPQKRSLNRWYVNGTKVPYAKTATPEHFAVMPDFLRSHRNFGRGRWAKRYKTDELYQKMMKNMYRMVSEVDETCGKILAELEKQGVLNQTMVIFTTDNGNLHGEHGMAEKWYPYEESIRVPLIIMDPRMPEELHGKRNDEFTLNIDLAPTMLSAAKIAVPKVMQGRDMAKLYLQHPYSYNPPDERFLRFTNATMSEMDEFLTINNLAEIHYMHETSNETWRKEFYYEWFSGDKNALPSSLALVRKNGKYIHWPEWNYEQLFRLDNDPFEEKDLMHYGQVDEAYLEEMKLRMSQLKKLAAQGVPL